MENSTMSMKEKVMNMMTMKMEELTAECEQAKLKFADIMLDDNADYRCKDSRRLKCTNIEAQMDLLQSMIRFWNLVLNKASSERLPLVYSSNIGFSFEFL